MNGKEVKYNEKVDSEDYHSYCGCLYINRNIFYWQRICHVFCSLEGMQSGR